MRQPCRRGAAISAICRGQATEYGHQQIRRAVVTAAPPKLLNTSDQYPKPAKTLATNVADVAATCTNATSASLRNCNVRCSCARGTTCTASNMKSKLKSRTIGTSCGSLKKDATNCATPANSTHKPTPTPIRNPASLDCVSPTILRS